MSGAMRKMGVYLGLLEDTDRFEDDYGQGEYDERPAARAAEHAEVERPTPVANLAERRRPASRFVSLPRSVEKGAPSAVRPLAENHMSLRICGRRRNPRRARV